MDNTANILEPNKSTILSLLRVIGIFQFRIFYDKDNEEENFVEAISIKCDKGVGLYLKDTIIEEMISKFVLNVILYHVSMLSIILSNNIFYINSK